MLNLPETATAPFCPSEVRGSVETENQTTRLRKLFVFLGPALLVSVGYMDPGNWATDIEAGSKFGYQLLSIVAIASAIAIFLQCLSVRLGVATQADLAQVTRKYYSTRATFCLWLLAEISIIACDLAEVLGCALAFHLLLGVSLEVGIGLTALDTLLVLGLKGKGFRRIESIVLALISVIGICYVYELYLVQPNWPHVWRGFAPDVALFSTPAPWYLAIGILGATVMPHNLYLHSSIVQSRKIGDDLEDKKKALRFLNLDTVLSLTLAFFVNAAILILAAAAFHYTGHDAVADIEDAYQLLQPIVGAHLAPTLFGVALLTAGQSSTFTGTIAGQVILEGHLDLKIACWKRRLITRALALGPAFAGVLFMGHHAIGKMLILSQVVLSLQLPFSMYPLIRFASRQDVMGELKLSRISQATAWAVFAVISLANIWLVIQIWN